MTEANLVSSCEFSDQEYVIRMNAEEDGLEITVTDKGSAEEWRCSYDAPFIENLTQRTGNYKKFAVFVAMLKSSLLKTSECVSLELLTYEDLEALRVKRVRSSFLTSKSGLLGQKNRDKRYLILTYTVEFDRIHYPLPLDYCGPPNPAVLQMKVQKLQTELAKLRKSQGDCPGEGKRVATLQRRLDELTEENATLKDEIKQLNHKLRMSSNDAIGNLQKAIVKLEKNVLMDERSHHQLVNKMTREKVQLLRELEKVRSSERTLKMRLRDLDAPRTRTSHKADPSLDTIYKKKNPQPQQPLPRRRLKAKAAEQGEQRHRRPKTNAKRSCSSCSSRSEDRNCKSDSGGKTTPCAHSRSSSLASRSSSVASRTKPKRKSNPKVESLRERIASLQKLLDKNMKMNND